MAEIENAEKHRRQWCSSCCYESPVDIIDTNKFIKYIMDPFEKYEPWENPEDKLDDFVKLKVVQEYRKADAGDIKNKVKRKQLSRLILH